MGISLILLQSVELDSSIHILLKFIQPVYSDEHVPYPPILSYPTSTSNSPDKEARVSTSPHSNQHVPRPDNYDVLQRVYHCRKKR